MNNLEWKDAPTVPGLYLVRRFGRADGIERQYKMLTRYEEEDIDEIHAQNASGYSLVYRVLGPMPEDDRVDSSDNLIEEKK